MIFRRQGVVNSFVATLFKRNAMKNPKEKFLEAIRLLADLAVIYEVLLKANGH